MERRQARGSDVLETMGHRSGVFRSVTSRMFAQLEHDMAEAASRVAGFRALANEGSAAFPGSEAIWKALQEIEAAHEGLRMIEEELHAQADEIVTTRESVGHQRRLYGELFEAAPEAYLVTDLKGLVTHANVRACALFKLDCAFLVGKPLAALIAPVDRGHVRALLLGMSDVAVHRELRIQVGEDGPGWVALTAQRGTEHGAGDCVRWLIRSSDAQVQHEARRDATEEALRKRVEELEASQHAIGQLLEREQRERQEANDKLLQKERVLAEVAHELRGPLATIGGWLRVMEGGHLELGVRKRAMLSMTRGVGALSRIIEELIEHTRIERRQLTLDARPINLVRAVVEVMEDLRPLAGLKHIVLELAASSYSVDVRGDTWRLQQVIRNLVGNAIKFTPEHGRVRVEVETVGNAAEVTITDSGRGIPPADLRKLFKPFTQLGAPGRDEAGLGLGLSIALRLVELHGGTIAAESDGPGRGAKFRVRLPLLSLNN